MSKSHVISRLLAATTAAFTLTSGCAMSNDDAREDAFEIRQASSELSDQELFREILFPNAASAAKVPELGRIYEAVHFDQLAPEQLEAITAFQDLLVQRIDETDPTFFAEFRTEVTSGDVLRVDAAMTDAHDIMTEAVGSLSSEFALLTQAGSLEALRNGSQGELGPETLDILDNIEHLDPSVLLALHEMLLNHAEMFDIPLDASFGTHSGIVVGAVQQVELISGAVLNNDQDGAYGVNVYYQTEVAVWAYVAAVVAVAVVAAVVEVVVVPFGSAEYINGNSTALYRDQLIFNLTEAYAA